MSSTNVRYVFFTYRYALFIIEEGTDLTADVLGTMTCRSSLDSKIKITFVFFFVLLAHRSIFQALIQQQQQQQRQQLVF